MKFVVTFVHTPEHCFARKEYMEEGKRWIKQMNRSAEKLGIKMEGAYVTPNEHTFYFILECDDLGKMSEFFGPPMLTHHSAKVAAVVPVEEAFGLTFMKKP